MQFKEEGHSNRYFLYDRYLHEKYLHAGCFTVVI